MAKAVLIVVCPFLVFRRDCAASFTPRQLLKGDGLHKNDRRCDLFGVGPEALSGGGEVQPIRLFNCLAVESQFVSIRNAARHHQRVPNIP